MTFQNFLSVVTAVCYLLPVSETLPRINPEVKRELNKLNLHVKCTTNLIVYCSTFHINFDHHL